MSNTDYNDAGPTFGPPDDPRQVCGRLRRTIEYREAWD